MPNQAFQLDVLYTYVHIHIYIHTYTYIDTHGQDEAQDEAHDGQDKAQDGTGYVDDAADLGRRGQSIDTEVRSTKTHKYVVIARKNYGHREKVEGGAENATPPTQNCDLGQRAKTAILEVAAKKLAGCLRPYLRAQVTFGHPSHAKWPFLKTT